MSSGRWTTGAVLLAIAALLPGCGDDSPTAPEEQVESVTVTPESETLVALDATVQLGAEAQDAGGSAVTDVELTWSSSDESVATVDGTGLAIAQGNGTAEIVAAAGEAADTAELTVDQEVSTVEVTPAASTVTGVDATVEFSAEAFDSNGNSLTTQPSFTWFSTEESVATVDESGVATAAARGSAEISATAESVSDAASLTVEGILHWTDGTAATSAVPGALDSLGVTATTAADSTEFASLLQEGGWGLVVFGEQLNAVFQGTVQAELEGYVTDGGRLLAVTWQDSPLPGFLRATRTDTNYSDLTTDDHEIFEGLPDNISITDPEYGTYASAYTADPGGECLGGTSVGDCGAILGHGDRTLLLGPLFDTYETLAEGEVLLAQSMEFLIDASAGAVASDVLDYDREASPTLSESSNLEGGR